LLPEVEPTIEVFGSTASRNWPITSGTGYCHALLPDIVVAACGGAHNTGVRVHGFQELTNNEWDGLDSFHLLLGVEVLLLQVPLLVLHKVDTGTR
jgi:hypothetical protein